MQAMTAVYEWLDLRRLGFVSLFLALMIFISLSDSDYFWHLQTGQYLFEHRTLPAGDIFSYTRADQPWVLHEWLFELMLYGVHSLLGPLGVKLMTAGFATTTMIVAYSTAKHLLDKPYPAFFLTLVFFAPIAIGVSPRPQLVTYLLFAVFLSALIKFKHLNTTRVLWLLPLLMMIWVNAHGGYVAGLALMILFTLCEWVAFLVQQHPDSAHKHRLMLLSLVTGLTILASLANPYFINHWFYPFRLMNMESTQNSIAEWQSPDFHSVILKVYLVLVLATLIAAMYRKVRPGFSEIVVTIFFVTASFVAIRHIPLSAIALIPFAAATLAQLSLEDILSIRRLDYMQKIYQRIVRGGSDLGRTEFMFNWILLVLIMIGCLLYYPSGLARESDKVNKMLPVKATQFIIQAGIQGRMFNSYGYGGFLIHSLYPKQKVFIDGRSDMYGDAFMKEYEEINNGKADWEKTFDSYQIDYVIVQRDTPLRQLLLKRGDFKLVYDDEVNSVLLKNRDQYAAILSKYTH